LHKEGISKMLVSDYYSQKAISAKEAYYVVGSDVYGPMGEELIPFAKESEAKTFYMDHKGSKILRFDEITEMEIKKLDE
ncbi:MAG: nitrous oxide reductase accessory protein NosL, partial [Sulfurimonas sp.]|uniref:nitrous oxide reductase accessory protein NosL n=1 Tax=Sulfurimonas sp. TaxID=2022749 RepID=UPI0028CC6B7F